MNGTVLYAHTEAMGSKYGLGSWHLPGMDEKLTTVTTYIAPKKKSEKFVQKQMLL